VYALGCALYHLLAGHVPFPGGTSAEKVQRHLTRLPRPIEKRRPDLPAGLGDVLRRMMARRRKHRYQSAAEAAAALVPYATPFTDRPTGPTQPNNSIPSMPTTVDLPTTAGDRSASA
jgi:serine/threonine-protein kinase